MSTLGLELSDVGVAGVLIEDDGSTRVLVLGDGSERLPAYAYTRGGGDDIIFGAEAQELGQIYPRRAVSSFIDDLSLKSTDFDGARGRIAYSQIAYHFFEEIALRVHREVEGIDRVVLAVPGHYLESSELAEERLGILLGILRDVKLPVAGIVDMAAASLYSEGLWNVAEGERLFHVDMLSHATHVTVFNKRHGLERAHFSRQPQHGFFKLQERFAGALAERFLRQTSFDVTEDQGIERAFHARAREMLFQLGKSGEALLEVSTSEKSRQMTVTRDVAAADLAPYVKVLTQMLLRAVNDFGTGEKATQIVLSERAAAIQGLKESIAAQGIGVVKELPPESAAFGAANCGKLWEVPADIGDVRIETGIQLEAPELGLGGERVARSPVGAIRVVKSGKSLNPTHMVCDGLAYELGQGAFVVGFGESEDFDLVVERDLARQPVEIFRLQLDADGWRLDESKGATVECSSISYLRAGDGIELALPGLRKQLLLIHCLQ